MADADASPGASLMELPDLCIHHIFSSLSARDACNFAATCRRLHELGHTELLWALLMRRDYGTYATHTPVHLADTWATLPSLDKYRYAWAASHAVSTCHVTSVDVLSSRIPADAALGSYQPAPQSSGDASFRSMSSGSSDDEGLDAGDSDGVASEPAGAPGQEADARPGTAPQAPAGHAGPIFGLRMCRNPLPPTWAVSGGVDADTGSAEVVLLDFENKRSHTLLYEDCGEHEGSGGVFHVTQRHQLPEIVVTGFSGACTVYRLDLDAGDSDAHPDSRPRPASGPPSARAAALKPLVHLSGHVDPVVSSTSDANWIATASFDGQIRMFRTGDWERDEELPGEVDACTPAFLDETLVKVGDGKWHPMGRVRQVRPTVCLSDAAVDQSTEGNSRTVSALALDPDGAKALLSGGNDAEAKRWCTERGVVTQRMVAHRGWIWCLELLRQDSADCFLTGATDSCVCLWDARQGNHPVDAMPLSRNPAVPSGPVAGLRMHPSLPLFVTSSFDGFLRVVDLRNFSVVGALSGGGGRLTRTDCTEDMAVAASFHSYVVAFSFGPQEF